MYEGEWGFWYGLAEGIKGVICGVMTWFWFGLQPVEGGIDVLKVGFGFDEWITMLMDRQGLEVGFSVLGFIEESQIPMRRCGCWSGDNIP